MAFDWIRNDIQAGKQKARRLKAWIARKNSKCEIDTKATQANAIQQNTYHRDEIIGANRKR